MRKIIALALTAFASGYAQPVIQSNYVQLNFPTEAYFAEVQSFDPGPAGANRNWTITGLDLYLVGNSTTISPVGTPFENSFPTANFCSATTGQFQGGYSYFRLDTQKMELLGEAFTGIGVFTNAPNPRTYIEFPYTYNRVINDTYHADNIAFTSTYDGYGALTVPFGTYHNVIRQKIEEAGTTNYVWFNVNPFFPIAQTVEGGIGLMTNPGVLSAAQFTPSEALVVAPNPSKDTFRIEGLATRAEIRVTDMRGQLIWQGVAHPGAAVIDLAHCASGVFILEVRQSDKTHIQKIVKY